MKAEHDTLRAQVARRRTFAIIAHPDAGKTTLTEKLLLYGGAIHLAGAVKQKGARRQTTSDWMALERERGISVSTSVMHFEHRGCQVNLLDTPGHNDFSEDTYRTLSAVDSAVMLIDGVKGVEAQTIKLFEVCRMRRIPIVTFVNKLDREGRDPLDLLDEIERVLGIPAVPMTWPVGNGQSFQGVYDRERRQLLRFERADAGARRAPLSIVGLDDPSLRDAIGAEAHRRLAEDLALLDVAGDDFHQERFLAGEVTPVFFGSAMNNFGVEPFLDRFVSLAPPPRPRAVGDRELAPHGARFSGFVFKIQANMDPNHRDRIAFLRVASGRFVRGMQALHVRSGRTLTLNKSLTFFAQDRKLLDEAYAGDIVGLWDPGVLRIGDTVAEDDGMEFDEIPRFSPEHFARVRIADPMKRKQLKKGLDQLSEEGAVQVFYDRRRLERDPVLGAVGVLQFEVLAYRMRAEYGVELQLDRLPYRHARWVEGEGVDPEKIEWLLSTQCLLDASGRPLILFADDWALSRATQQFPELKLVAAVQPARMARGAAA
jgi:peptide chain release factor 3